jgi:hypothetical protein
MIQWTFDPATVHQVVVITCYKRPLSRQPWRWRAQSAGNRRKLANAGEAFSTPEALAHNLSLLWPPETTRHIVVKGLP